MPPSPATGYPLGRADRRSLGRAAGWAAAYAGWIVAFKLLVLTLITYFLVSSRQTGHTARFDDITEVVSSNEVTLMGTAAVLFVAATLALSIGPADRRQELFTGERFEKLFLPGFLHGAVIAMGVVLAFVLAGTHRYFGFLLSFDDAATATLLIVVRAAAILLLAYCEEFIFRRKIAQQLRGTMSPLAASLVVAVVYCAIKMLQFDMGVMHLITFFLISVALSLRASQEGDFVQGAGFLASLFVVFHPLLSLPILGNDFTGLVMIKYQAAGAETLEPSLQQSTLRVLTGGAGGPFSGLAFQILLILDIARGILRRK